jgi:3-keto-disaccharide hydrolase
MIRRIVPLSLFVAALAFSAICQPGFAGKDKKAPEIPPREGTSEMIHLFNGKDLDGWEGYKDLWSVHDGVIVGKNTKPVNFSTYLLTKRKFSDFRLVFSAKLLEGSEMHSGVAIWGKKFPDVKGVVDPKKSRTEYTYQGQLVMFPSHWGLYDLYRREGAINPSQEIRNVAIKAGKQHDWNDMEILAQGNRIRLVVNGKQVLDWRDPQPELVNEGPIGLQLHSEKVPQELHFKGLVLTTFPEDKLTTVK